MQGWGTYLWSTIQQHYGVFLDLIWCNSPMLCVARARLASLSSFYPVNQDFYLPKGQKKIALNRNNPRDRVEKLQRIDQGAELFFQDATNSSFWGPPTWFPGGRTNLPPTPWPPDSKAWRTLMKAGKQWRKTSSWWQIWKVKKKKTLKSVSEVPTGAENPYV